MPMRYNYFVPTGYQDFVQKFIKILKNDEPCVVLFTPRSDRLRRIDQLIQDYSSEINLLKIDLTPGETSDVDDIIYTIEKSGNGKIKEKTGIIVTNAELIIQEKNYSTLNDIIKLQHTSSFYRFLFCFETDITHPDISKWLTESSLFSNIIYYPLYKRDDMMVFVNYLAEFWNLQIKEPVKEKIINNCGGYLWLAVQIVRVLRDDPYMPIEDIFQSDQIRFRLERIYYSLVESEHNVIHNIIKGSRIEGMPEKHSYEYLKKLRIIEDDEIAIPLLSKFIRENMPKVAIQVSEKELLLNNINVESNFSRKEKRAIKTLLESKGQIVSRERIAKALWPLDTEEKYSDWAVDRLISRLRNKLRKLGLPRDVIKTLRNRGYMLIN